VGRGDFVYFDPPYFKLGGYSDFNRYTPGQFRARDHIRLAAVCRELDQRGVLWAISNSNTALVRDLFKGYRMSELTARREINLRSASRDVSELLVTNFDVADEAPPPRLHRARVGYSPPGAGSRASRLRRAP
jgi:DNA adenine methylase